MEPHELAIAALQEVAHSSHRDPRHPRSNATGIDRKDNAIDDDDKADAPPQDAEHPSSSQASVPLQVLEAHDLNGTVGRSGSSDISQSTTDAHEVFSPPTSASDGFSSQSTNPDGLSQLSQLSQLAAAQQPMNTSRHSLSTVPTAGHKRTADGQVKPFLFDSATSPMGRHSRNTSTASASSVVSRIGEVIERSSFIELHLPSQISSELRTRLTYAMVKVNNGWQLNSIDEVESLASKTGSPASSTSTVNARRLVTSPRTELASIQSQSMSQADFDLYSRGDQPSRTYESFWRDHSTNPVPPRSHLSPKASLAPSADIQSSRRPHTPKYPKPPTIATQSSLQSQAQGGPRTPNRTNYLETKSAQTPTQKTIQEQDAIETLLFMSSPGNSGNMNYLRNQGSPQQSPLRAEFNERGPRRKVGLEKGDTSTGSSETDGYTRSVEGEALKRERKEAIESLLDEMSDSNSDGEMATYSSPRRVAAGRV